MNGVLLFMSHWGMFILFVGGGTAALLCVVASLRYERLKRRRYVEQAFGRAISEAEKRQLERAL